MGLEEQQAEGPAVERVLVEQVLDGPEVVERLRHLLAVDVEHRVVHPVAGEVAARGDRLGPFVRVVREHEVVAAAVEVEAVAEHVEAHRHTLDVPAGAALAPRRRPGRFARLGRLPECEVERVLLVLVDLDPGAGPFAEVVEGAVDESAVAVDVGDSEVDAGVVDVGGSVVDQRADEVDHLFDVFGGVGPVVGSQHAEPVEDRLVVDGLPRGGDLRFGRPLVVGPG